MLDEFTQHLSDPKLSICLYYGNQKTDILHIEWFRFLSNCSTEIMNYVDLPLPCYLWKLAASTTRVERLWCLSAVGVVALCLALIIYFTSRGQDVEDVAPHEWNITRAMWLARKYDTRETTEAFEPLRLVVVQHSVSQECHRFVTCAAELRNLQAWNIRDCHCDIAYNFVIGNEGRVYEGRGWRKVGAHTGPYNRCALGIGFIGDYREEIPMHSTVSTLQLNRTLMLLEYGVQRGYLHPDYFVVGAKDITSSASPGSNLYNAIRQWPHFHNGTGLRDKTCEYIYDSLSNESNGTRANETETTHSNLP